ncbi:MAG: homoserine O-succinyltransferase [Clostridia bacterium]|nr:homoserine O-succinyltransferase [Clostridia bacterium]
MPIKIDNQLPARKSLENENVFVMTEFRAQSQDIRPLKILLLNLMPTKIETETQILRLLSNSPLQLEVDLLHTATHKSKNVSEEHLTKFYNSFNEIRNNRYDGMIVTGAPVEKMEFEEVDYWEELCEIFEWSKTNVYSTFNICWGAQASLYYRYGVKKYPSEKKVFGIFPHRALDSFHPLIRGLDDIFYVPHSRHTVLKMSDIAKVKDLQVISYSEQAGIHILSDMDCRNFFITGHSEYDRDTLKNEYMRDVNLGLEIDVPVNYFPDDNPDNTPVVTWRSTANLIFSNWLNYFVYQKTPYDLSNL